MVSAPIRSIIPSLKLGDYLSVQAHKPCSISHLDKEQRRTDRPKLFFILLRLHRKINKLARCDERRKKGLNLNALSAKWSEIFFFFFFALQSFHLHWKK